jgi:hypothetical protein
VPLNVCARRALAIPEMWVRGRLPWRFGRRTPDVLGFLERRGDIVQVGDGRYYLAAALRELVDTLRGRMQAGRAYAPAEIREMLGSSR